MDYLWLLLVLFVVVVLYAGLEYFFARALGHTAVQLIIRAAGKIKNLNPELNQHKAKTARKEKKKLL